MGCDIHLYVERKINGKWVSADKWTPDEEESERKVVTYDDSFYNGRNYSLFAILADVRNEGTAYDPNDAVDAEFNVIVPPRGIPKDACSSVKAEAVVWDWDGHNHSWLTLAELLAFDWTQKNQCAGIIYSASAYWCWQLYKKQRGERPDSYCMGTSKKTVTEAGVFPLINAWVKATPFREPKFSAAMDEAFPYSVKVEWEATYYQCCTHFLGTVIPRLLRLGKPDDVRIVFWFDN